ncbi:HAD family hydrolase [Actinoplanes regularis]|uniref:Putative hydrolase of the HAD superfamily n=1 Tax=Actinoplanes regularis TaxID=52697 RepID=A0A239K0P8_9ACTN|nr:HAD-IA family hydrolase [Actinoplanes regularis]GIE92341.1 hypothetical protein Are01nite_88210 [Actinoplanes regularis]SNT11886.1 putative hydrolase of the HAD superfamily [Actinoplanes regularis]
MTAYLSPGTAPFDAVLCDVDGVIRYYDHSEVACLERAVGLREGATAGIAFAPENDLPLLLGQISREQWVASIAATLAKRVPESEAHALAAAFDGAGFRADAAVVGMLRQVRAHCPVVLVTNATVWLDEDLALLGLTDLADHVINSSLVGVAKPDRRIFELAADRVGAAADRCLFVDDLQENVDAAIRLGMQGIVYRAPADLRVALSPILSNGALTPPE